MNSDPKDQKIAALEKQLDRANNQINELARRISFLERENNRRKQEVNQIARSKG